MISLIGTSVKSGCCSWSFASVKTPGFAYLFFSSEWFRVCMLYISGTHS